MKISKNFALDPSRKDDAQLVGKTFGRLTATQVAGYFQESETQTRTAYLFQCACGKQHINIAKVVLGGHTLSCGCLKVEKVTELGKKLKQEKTNNPAFQRYYNQYKSRAKRAGLEFSLSEEEFKNITSSNCHYCNSSATKEYGDNWKGYSLPYICNGIDRKDNTIGYTLENALPCCSMCNYAKKNYDYSYFIDWLNLAGTYQINKKTINK